MDIAQGAKFERPVPGMYLATLVDIVDLPKQQTQYGVKDRLRFHWVLAYLNGQLYLDKNGKPVEATANWNANMGVKAELPKRLTQILGQAPPVVTKTEELEALVLGRSNVLVLVASPNPKDPNDPYINVDGIGPLSPGMPSPPPIPQGYVRFKNRPKTVAGPNGQSVQTYASPAAAQAAAAPVGPPPNSAQPTAEQIAAYLAAQQQQAPAAAPAPYANAAPYVPPAAVNIATPPAAAPQGVDPNGKRPF